MLAFAFSIGQYDSKASSIEMGRCREMDCQPWPEGVSNATSPITADSPNRCVVFVNPPFSFLESVMKIFNMEFC
jgi:hypothetical protein